MEESARVREAVAAHALAVHDTETGTLEQEQVDALHALAAEHIHAMETSAGQEAVGAPHALAAATGVVQEVGAPAEMGAEQGDVRVLYALAAKHATKAIAGVHDVVGALHALAAGVLEAEMDAVKEVETGAVQEMGALGVLASETGIRHGGVGALPVLVEISVMGMAQDGDRIVFPEVHARTPSTVCSTQAVAHAQEINVPPNLEGAAESHGVAIVSTPSTETLPIKVTE